MPAEWLRNYGSAIGPSIAFLFGICALYVKAWFDRRQRHQKSKNLLEQFGTLALVEPPELFEVPDVDGYEKADKAKANRDALTRYYNRLMTAKSFLDINEKYIVDDAPMPVLRRLSECKWRFERLCSVARHHLDNSIPLQPDCLQEIEAWRGALKNQASAT